MTFKPTFITMIIAALSVAVVMYVLRLDSINRSAGDVGDPGSFIAELKQLPIDDVTRIELTRGLEEKMVFERREGRWLQIEPFAYPMELFSIRQLVVLAGQLARPGSVLPVELSQAGGEAALGIDPPRATILYQWEGKSLRIELGRLVGAGRAYLRLGGDDRIYSVDQSLHQRAIQMDFREWRDRKIFRDVSVDADAIERLAGTDRLVVHRENRQWKMIEPVPSRLNTEALERWLQGMDRAKIASFIVDDPDDLAQFGLDPPVASLTLSTTRRVSVDGDVYPEPQTQKLLIGAEMGATTKDRFAKLEQWPVVFRLSFDAQARMFPFTRDIVAQTASGVSPSAVKAITIQTADSELRLERDLETWHAPDRGNVVVESRYVNDLFRQLLELRPHRVELDQFPVDQEVAKVIFLGYDRRPIDTVRVARDETGDWILENGDDVLRYFPESLHLRLLDADFGLVSPLPD